MKQSTASIVRWREVLALFERVLETNDATRPELLRSIASEQPELYPQLLTMLAADRSAESVSFIFELFRKTLAEQTKLRGETHSSVGRTRRLLAEALYDVGQLNESIAFAQDALEKSRKSTTPSRVADARLLSLLGRTYLRAGEKKRAKEALAEAERLWLDNKEAYGTGVTALNLAQLYESESEPAKAIVQIEKALSLLENTRGKTRNEYWRARVAHARLAPASERVQTLEQVYANFKLEAEHVHFPRAQALILEELAAAQALANRRADSCKTLTVAVPLRERLDNLQAASTLRLQAKKTEMCTEIALR